MSAQRREPPEPTPDAPRDEEDPYGIVPDGFLAQYPAADTIAEALRMAERAASETDPDEFERCPRCLSTQLRQKPGTAAMPHKREGNIKCMACQSHAETALPSLVDAQRTADHAPTTDRETDRPRCRECLSTALYPKPEGAPGPDTDWACLDCQTHFDDALPSWNAVRRGDATREELAAIGAAFREHDDVEFRSPAARATRRAESYGPSEQATLEEVRE